MQCISPIYLSKERIFVPCSKCNFCLAKNRSAWSFRCHQELKHAQNAFFLTLTYNDENIPFQIEETGEVTTLLTCDDFDKINTLTTRPTLRNEDVVKFLKRLRKYQYTKLWKNKYNNWFDWQSIRYYLVGEYGSETQRPHYHVIIFNLTLDTLENLSQIWGKGFVQVDEVNGKVINYVTRYVITRHTRDYSHRQKPFAHMSRNPGLGAEYTITHTKWHTAKSRNYVVNDQKYKQSLPRYYADRIFQRAQRERISHESRIKSEQAFETELQRLSKYHDDPYMYYYERLQRTHDDLFKTMSKDKL